MKIFYDTEFLERGYKYSIDLISIGMVREDGEELYLINRDAPLDDMYKHEWLLENVVPHLPCVVSVFPSWDKNFSDYQYVLPRDIIAGLVKQFVLVDDKPELWAWYGAYDHVVIAQLFNTMSELPEGFPMWTNDLRQVTKDFNVRLPSKSGTEHHALEDARWLKKSYEFVEEKRKAQ